MIVEHWYEDPIDPINDIGSTTVFPAGMADCHYWDASATRRFYCQIEGESWEDCMRKYHEHMGWEPYKPMEDDDSSSRTSSKGE